MTREAREHVYVTPAEGEHCRGGSKHDRYFSESRMVGLCIFCGRCFWCSDLERCPGGLRTPLKNASEADRAGALSSQTGDQPRLDEGQGDAGTPSPRPSRRRAKRKKAVA